MPTTDELVAIVAGSLGALIVLLIILGIILYLLCGRKKKTVKHEKRFHQIPQHTESSLSKQSTLSHPVDPRLPKVGSSGLWLGSPSLYPGSPADAYYIEPDPRRSNNQMQHALRSSSQDRMGGRMHNPGHVVYQGNLKIYHSAQQMPTVYEPYNLPRAGSYMNVYPPYHYGYAEHDLAHSRAMLLEYPDIPEYYQDPNQPGEFKRGKKVRRSQSDVTQNSTRRYRQKRRQESPYGRQGGNRAQQTTVADVHPSRPKERAPPPPRLSSSQREDPPLQKSVDPSVQVLDPSATDSAKIRAHERSKDKDSVLPAKWNITDDDKHVTGVEQTNEADDLHIRHYSYTGDVSPTSAKVKEVQSSRKYENPIVARMDEMVKEKVKQPSSSHHGPNVKEVRKTSHSSNSGPIGSSFVSTGQYHIDAGKSGPSSPIRQSTSPNVHGAPKKDPNNLRRLESTDLAKEGKTITNEAFDFLDSYLSDDDGTEYLGSGRQSPIVTPKGIEGVY